MKQFIRYKFVTKARSRRRRRRFGENCARRLRALPLFNGPIFRRRLRMMHDGLRRRSYGKSPSFGAVVFGGGRCFSNCVCRVRDRDQQIACSYRNISCNVVVVVATPSRTSGIEFFEVRVCDARCSVIMQCSRSISVPKNRTFHYKVVVQNMNSASSV